MGLAPLLCVCGSVAYSERARCLRIADGSVLAGKNGGLGQAAGFSFLAGLLQGLKPSAFVLILDCTFKLFPEIESVASMHGWQAMRPAWPADINGHCKSVLVLRRGA